MEMKITHDQFFFFFLIINCVRILGGKCMVELRFLWVMYVI